MIAMHELERYAEIMLRGALDVQAGDQLILFIPDAYQNMAEIIKASAQKLGCRKIDVFYDSKMDEWNHYASGKTDKYIWLSEEEFGYIEHAIVSGALLLVMRSEYFGLFESLPPEAKQLRTACYMQDFFRIFKYVQADQVQYCLGALPNPHWAKTVFPQLSDGEALAALWDKMSKAIYLDTPMPYETWRKRAVTLTERRNALNDYGFDEIRFQGDGTDLVVKLPQKAQWQGGLLKRPNGREFIPNIPTEEVFTTPLRDGASGTLAVNKDFFFGGSLVPSYTLTFENGKLTDVFSPRLEFAEKLLQSLDEYEGGRYLGEIALVSNDAGVKRQNMFFYDMVYDENASCHFAFGSSYRNTIVEGDRLSDGEFVAAGGNLCQMHMDFMIDSENMRVSGMKDGDSHLILDNGNWVLKYK